MTPPNLHCYIYSSDEGLVAKFYQTMRPERTDICFYTKMAFDLEEYLTALKMWQSSCVKTVKVHPTHTEKVWKRVRLNSHQVVLDHIETDFKEGIYCEGIEVKRFQECEACTTFGICQRCFWTEYAFLSDNKREEKEESQDSIFMELATQAFAYDLTKNSVSSFVNICKEKFTITRK